MSALEVVTFGCRLNAQESAALAVRARTDGIGPAVIVNTCAVTGEAVRQARQAVRGAGRRRPDARLIVTGCAAQIDPDAFAGLPGVDLVLGNREKRTPGALLRRGVEVGDIMAPTKGSAHWMAGADQGDAARPRGCVEVQTGCDHRCTFCVIPFGRGDARSRTPETIIDEIRLRVSRGAREVVLTGVDLTSWGQARADSESFAGASFGALVRRVLAEVPELPRLRLSSIDAAEIDDDLLAAFADPRLMPHLHLSLQSGDDLILKRMKRRHSRAQAFETIAKVRAVRPEIAFGADIIVGFPTESEAAFANTVDLVTSGGLAFLHVFPFSARPGTPASRMPPVASEVIKARAARLRTIADAARSGHMRGLAGLSARMLIERRAPDQSGAWLGKIEDFTDAVARRAPDAGWSVGDIVEGRIAGCDRSAVELADATLVT